MTRDKILEHRTVAERVGEARRQGLTVVFTNGCFDLLHAGHVEYLEQAKARGDLLVVAINADDSVRRIKGPSRPINPLEERARVLAGLGCVDFVVPFSEADPLDLIELLRPDVLVKGADWPVDRIVGGPQVRRWGGNVIRLPLHQGISTTLLIQRIVQSYRNRGGSGFMERIDHIAVVVDDLDRALASYEAIAGQSAELREDDEEEGLRSAFLSMGQLVVELIEPRKAGPLARFLETYGPGLHHIAYRVKNMEAALAKLDERGIKPLDENVRHDEDGISIFLDPADTGGVLTELIQR